MDMSPDQNPNPEDITPRQIVYLVLGLVVLGIIFFAVKSARTPKPMDPTLPSQIDRQIFNK